MTRHRPTAMAALALLAGLTVGLTAAGCQPPTADPSPSPTVGTQAHRWPDNLCELLLAADPPDHLELREEAHETAADAHRSTASCTLTGTRFGSPVTVEVDAVSFGGRDERAATEAMDAAFADACAELRSAAGTTYEQSDPSSDCSIVSAAAPAGARGEVTEVQRLTMVNGLVTVRMVDPGELGWQTVPAEVSAMMLTLLTEVR